MPRTANRSLRSYALERKRQVSYRSMCLSGEDAGEACASARAHRESARAFRHLERARSDGADVDRPLVRLRVEITVEVVLRGRAREDAAVSSAGDRVSFRREVRPAHGHQIVDLAPPLHADELEPAVSVARMREIAARVTLAQVVVARGHAL